MGTSHLTRPVAAGVLLDTWHCNARTTAGERLWVGVPPGTEVGETFAQRVAASLLHASGRDELVCANINQYERMVRQLAAEPQRRAALRERLLAQRTHPLPDGNRFARDIEAPFERMWQRAVSAQSPLHRAAAVRSAVMPATAPRKPCNSAVSPRRPRLTSC